MKKPSKVKCKEGHKCEGPHYKGKEPEARFAVRVLDSGTPETEFYYCQKCWENQEYWNIVNHD